MVTNLDQPISTLPPLTEAERHQILVAWNATTAPFPDRHCLHHLFEAQAAERPDAIAISFEGQNLTYGELNRRANQVAHYLQKRGVGPETRVGLALERSITLMVGLLGILKAGGAYVPLDPAYPPERLAFMLADAQVPVLLTQAHLIGRVPAPHATIIPLDSDWPCIAEEHETNPTNGVTPENLAYVIYTSGSTGQPKGVMVAHRGVCNLAVATPRLLKISPNSRVLQFFSLSFDGAVWEIFPTLSSGARLHLARPERLMDREELVSLLAAEGITHVTLPPSILAALPPAELPALKTLIVAGEACPAGLVARWAQGRDFFNAYGPTEATVCASLYLCPPNEVQAPPIGRPIANTELYILDSDLQPVPVGVAGELYIGGVGLARGYLNRPDLTQEKFIPHPFSSQPDARLYKTGDLARYRPDGNVEFVGRLDHQVKIRGFRIELGEIETVLRQHPHVVEAVVVARETGQRLDEKQLVAYFVPEPQTQLTPVELRNFLKQILPDYMIPSTFVKLAALPLSPAGKIDRQALPIPDPRLVETFDLPRTPLEVALAGIWAEVIGVPQVSLEDNFFELGGHSLLAAQVIARLREMFQIEVPLRRLFESPTLAAFTQTIEQIKNGTADPKMPAIPRVSRKARRLNQP